MIYQITHIQKHWIVGLMIFARMRKVSENYWRKKARYHM